MNNRHLSVGLEMVQQVFQPVLDQFIAGKLSELDLYERTEWQSRWVWPYESYLPILRVCRRNNIPLVALSMDIQSLSKLRSSGIESLSSAELRDYVGDPQVFASMAKEIGFKTYVSEIVAPSYASHARMGLLAKPNFNNFYTSRVLGDEAMATCVVRHVNRTRAPIICLMGSDHVKFEYGVSGRVKRQLVAERGREGQQQTRPALKTVMLNPTPADAFDPRDASLRLEMAVGDTPIPIADYLWFSSVGDAKPRRRSSQKSQKSRKWLLPPVETMIRS